MKTGFKVLDVEVPAERDYRHINELIDSMPDVKHYIESIENHVAYLYETILGLDPDESLIEFITEEMILNNERDKRTRK